MCSSVHLAVTAAVNRQQVLLYSGVQQYMNHLFIIYIYVLLHVLPCYSYFLVVRDSKHSRIDSPFFLTQRTKEQSKQRTTFLRHIAAASVQQSCLFSHSSFSFPSLLRGAAAAVRTPSDCCANVVYVLVYSPYDEEYLEVLASYFVLGILYHSTYTYYS